MLLTPPQTFLATLPWQIQRWAYGQSQTNTDPGDNPRASVWAERVWEDVQSDAAESKQGTTTEEAELWDGPRLSPWHSELQELIDEMPF